MGAIMLSMALATLGIDVGWQKLPEGGRQYIIQIEPQTLEALRSGQAIQSDLPSNLNDIRSYRIVVGTKKLPRDPLPPAVILDKPALPPATQQPSAPPREMLPPAVSSDLAMKPSAGQRAVSKEPAAAPAAPSEPEAAPEALPPAPPKPWVPLIFTLLGLFASLGGNIYLGWVVLDLRKRCQSLLARLAGSSAG